MTPNEHQHVLQCIDHDNPEEVFIEYRIDELLSLGESWDEISAREQAKCEWHQKQLEHLKHV